MEYFLAISAEDLRHVHLLSVLAPWRGSACLSSTSKFWHSEPLVSMSLKMSPPEAQLATVASYTQRRLSVFLTRSFSDQQPLEELLSSEATESHVAPVVVEIPR